MGSFVNEHGEKLQSIEDCTMTDQSQAVREALRDKAQNKYWAKFMATATTWMHTFDHGFDDGYEAGVRAERERAAKVADAQFTPGWDEYTAGQANAADTIAAAIRKGE